MNKSKIYLVEWQDAHSVAGWHTNESIKKFIDEERCICINIGWILHEDKDEIVMAHRKLKWSETGDDEWGLLQKIPKTWIRKKVILKL